MDFSCDSHKILLVDDDPNVLMAYKRCLRKFCDSTTAGSGREGLEILDDEGPFAVVVADYLMPGMDGIEFLSRIRESYPETIRIMLTGHPNLKVAIGAVNSGEIFRFLTKPCEPDDLVRAVGAGVEQFKMVLATRELAVVRRLKEGLEGTLLAFTRLVEFRDPYTAGHMSRVARIAVMLAERLVMEPDRVEGLRLAGLVHDIGKIAVPAGILNKPGSLTDAEFALIKAHPLVGGEIFKTLDTHWPIARIIMEHHERLDGSGYPNGLRGDQMLEESRILAVADVIDALLTHRPYRHKLDVDHVMDMLGQGVGTRFEPRIVESALELLDTGAIQTAMDY